MTNKLVPIDQACRELADAVNKEMFTSTEWEPHDEMSDWTDLIFNPQLDAGIELSRKLDLLLRLRDKLIADANRYQWLRGEGPEVAKFWLQVARDPILTLKTLDTLVDRQIRLEAGSKS